MIHVRQLMKLRMRGAVCLLLHAVAQLVEALRYKPEGREFDSNSSLT
jgi:hypothetical protein